MEQESTGVECQPTLYQQDAAGQQQVLTPPRQEGCVGTLTPFGLVGVPDLSLTVEGQRKPKGGPLAWHALDPHLPLMPLNNRPAKQKSGATTKDNPQLKTILCEIAATIARSPGTYLHALYHRIARRRGKPRAMLAVAHSLLVSIYVMVRDQVPYQELGPDYFEHLQAQQLERHYVRRLEAMGFTVTLTPAAS